MATAIKQVATLPIPPFFDPNKVGEVWRVAYNEREAEAIAWAKQHGISAAGTDRKRIGLLLVDPQNTFCIPGFELYVGGRTGTGAVDDNRRLCEFIYRNLGTINGTIMSMDTHRLFAIFHRKFWVDAKGNHPAPYTMLSEADVTSGTWRVNPAAAAALNVGYVALQRYAEHYVKTLAASGKYALTIWPYHAMLGGIGHAIVPAVEEAVFFHAAARNSLTDFQIKGGNPLTENYSILQPEVMSGPEGQNIDAKNQGFIKALIDFDAVIIAGQAKSHCVAWTIENLLHEIMDLDPALAKKVYLLEDCTSPVVIPGVIDFTDQADEAFRKFSQAGMHVVTSTTPIASWPGMDAILS